MAMGGTVEVSNGVQLGVFGGHEISWTSKLKYTPDYCYRYVNM